MRAFTLAAAAALLVPLAATPALASAAGARIGPLASDEPASTIGGRAAAAAPAPVDSLAAVLDSLARDPNGIRLAAAAVHQGNQTVAAGTTVPGDIAAWHGDLEVKGTVTGNAVAIDGNVIVRQGGVVHGSALAVGGQVHAEGGTVNGEMRSLSALTVGPIAANAPPTRAERAKRSVSLAVGWYLVLAIIGVAVLLFARRNLETVAEAIRDDFSRSFFYGLLGQVALMPALVIGIVALAITIVGILLIPFAIVAFVLAVAGALALGFLAMSLVSGDAIMRWRGAVGNDWAPALQLLLIGLSVYFVLWALGGLLEWAGWLGGLVRLVAFVITWVAVTVGFGATVLSRGGTRSVGAPPTVPPRATEEYAWQTPTPVSGVAAARRPTPPPSSGTRQQ